jgi:RNA polymerase sigma-70 factor, ECF subfamily
VRDGRVLVKEPEAAAERASYFRAVLADERAFRDWYERSLPYVYGYVFDRCGGSSVAEELTQDTFVEAVRHQAGFDGRADPLTWVCGIARHKLADHFRRLEREERRQARLVVRHDEGQPDGDAFELTADSADAVRHALRSLPAMQGAALVLRYLDELSVREIAGLLGRSESAVESLLSRGREAFRRMYEAQPTPGTDDE